MKLIIDISDKDYEYVTAYAKGGTCLFALNNTSRIIQSVAQGTVLSECKPEDDITFKDDNAVSRLSVRDIIYANAYELEYPDGSSEYVVNRDELIKYLMELPTVYPKSETEQKLRNKTYLTMRELTPEEREAKNKAIRDMSYDTGVTLQGLLNHERYVPVSVLEDIKADIRQWYWDADKQAIAKDPCVVDAMVDLFIRTINKHMESEDKEQNNDKERSD